MERMIKVVLGGDDAEMKVEIMLNGKPEKTSERVARIVKALRDRTTGV